MADKPTLLRLPRPLRLLPTRAEAWAWHLGMAIAYHQRLVATIADPSTR